MAATSDVQICSNACLLLGKHPIASFEDSGVAALLCSNLWPMVRDSVLRRHPWNVAMKRVVLAPEAVAPAFDWAYSFVLPPDCLRVWRVGRQGDRVNYRLEISQMGGPGIVMDEATCYLTYIKQITDVTRYDALLTLAMTAGMAANLAYPLTKSQTEQDAMVKLFQMHMRDARMVDGMEAPTDSIEDSPLIDARVF